MRINTLTLEQFRNYTNATCNFTDHVTVVVGDNASGKSNLLEAVRLLSTTRSVHARVESQMVHEGSLVARVVSQFTTDNKELEIICALDTSSGRTKKIWKLQGAPKSSRAIVGQLTSLLFKPEDVDLLQRSSSARRELLDQLLVVKNQTYYSALQQLKQVLSQRQALLEQARGNPGAVADIYDRQLIKLSAYISNQRERLVASLLPSITSFVQQLNNSRDLVDIRLLSPAGIAGDVCPGSVSEWEEHYIKALQTYRNRELLAARNLIGAQREDLHIYVNNKLTREFGSRGEWRSVVVAFLLASVEYLEQKTGERPIVLLDDVLSELDPRRREVLIPFIQKQQTIITTADPGELPQALAMCPRIEIRKGLLLKKDYALA